MTHDELVRFSAGKLGITLEWRDGITPVYHLGLFSLTSPELFLKGLEAFEKSGGDWVINKNGMLLGLGNDDRYIPVTGFYKISDIPLIFWQCWAELEGGQW